MAILPLCLVLIAALIHASWNLLAKTSAGDIRFALLTSIVLAIFWAPVGIYFAWHEVPNFGLIQWTLIVASAAVHVIYFVTLLRGYRYGDLSVVYPLARGTGPLITAIVATTFLGEVLGLVGWLGVLGIVGGIVLIAGGPSLLHALRTSERALADSTRLHAGVWYGLLTGAFVAAYTVIDGYAVKHAGISPIALDYLGNIIRLPLTVLLILLMGHREPLPMHYVKTMWRPAIIIGIVAPMGYVLVLYAVSMAPLSQVAPAREVSMLFATFLGGSLLGERSIKIKLLGAASIAAGVIALALS